MLFVTLRWLSVVPLLAGVYLGLDTALFLNNSEQVIGVIAPSDPYRGPPRSPRSIPVTVTFTRGDGVQHQVTLPSPIFRRLGPGDALPLRVAVADPTKARTALLPDLWGYPCGFFVGGLGLLIFASAALKVKGTPRTKVVGNELGSL